MNTLDIKVYGIDDFLNNLSAQTRKAYLKDLGDFIKFLSTQGCAPSFPKNLKSGHFISYKESLIKKDFAPKTICRKLSTLKSVIKWLIIQGHIDKDPTLSLKMPIDSVKKPTKVFMDEQVETMLDSAKCDRDLLIMLLLFSTGLRRSELLGINTYDIYSEGKHQVFSIKGKGGKIRDVPIPSHVFKVLTKYCDDNNLSGKLFNITDSGLYKLIKRYAKNLGIEDRSPHSCRATFITKTIEEGAPMKDVADTVGHASIATTQIYWRRRRGFDNSPVYKTNYGCK